MDIANEYEFHDLVAIHPNTGSLYAMTSVDKLVKAPLNLASRKYESGQPDGPKDYWLYFGAVAQLGERLNGIQEVSGSIPLSSTDLKAFSRHERGFFCFK